MGLVDINCFVRIRRLHRIGMEHIMLGCWIISGFIAEEDPLEMGYKGKLVMYWYDNK